MVSLKRKLRLLFFGLSKKESHMKKIPETFELSEQDIKEAISHWLNEEHCDGEYAYDFDITFDSSEEIDAEADRNYKGPRGGMYEPAMKTVITAKAVKE